MIDHVTRKYGPLLPYLVLNRENYFASSLVALITSASKCDLANKVPISISTSSAKYSFFNSVPITKHETDLSDGAIVGGAHGISTGNLTDFTIVVNPPYYEAGGYYLYACGAYDMGSIGTGICLQHAGASLNWGAIDLASTLPHPTYISSGEKVPQNGLYHILVHTRDGTNHRVYRNGILKNTVAGNNGNAAPTLPFVQNNLSHLTTGNVFGSVASIVMSGRFNRCLTDVEVFEFSNNPYQIFKKSFIPVSPLINKVLVKVAYPISDIADGAWQPSTGVDLYPTLDETSPDDSDYIYSLTGSSCTLELSPLIPRTTEDQIVKYRAKSVYSNTLVATLKQESTTIATRTHTSIPNTWTDYTMVLTTDEIALITDYTLLRITLEAQI